MNIASSMFKNLPAAVRCTSIFYTFLKGADGGFAFNYIRKEVP